MSDYTSPEPTARTGRTAPLWALIVIGVAALLVGLLAGALVLMGMQSGTNARLADAQRANAALSARVDALTASLTAAPAAVTTTAPSVPAPAPATPKPPATVKAYAYIKGASVSGSKLTVVADYVQYFTGGAATHEAAVHGGSVGYGGSYVLNQSSALRHLNLPLTAKVLLIEWFETGTAGSSIKTGEVTPQDFVNGVRGVLTSPSGVWTPAHHVFVLTVTGDNVSRVEQIPGY
jgi:hypothetical protein